MPIFSMLGITSAFLTILTATENNTVMLCCGEMMTSGVVCVLSPFNYCFWLEHWPGAHRYGRVHHPHLDCFSPTCRCQGRLPLTPALL